MRARCAWGAVIGLLAGCPAHLERNAPGNVDVWRMPDALEAEEVERPEDPGEEVVWISAGGLGGVGVRAGGDGRLAAEVGVEASVHWGSRERSHERDPLFPEVVVPDSRRGFNLGWIFREPVPRDPKAGELGPLYLEWQQSGALWGWAAGYSYDPQDGSHGPQVGVSGIGGYAKVAYRFERGAELLFGFVLKWPQSIVWSR